ncbi:MAG: DUF4266 domain-containing protein [Kofleriaceae bacterium]
MRTPPPSSPSLSSAAARAASLALLALAAVLAGCGRNAVRATEKEFLADQIMTFDEDAHETAADTHVLTNREGSAGGKGAKGGGCGCN